MICHQYKIRIQKEQEEHSSLPFELTEISLDKTYFKEISRDEAKKIILEYEWLKSVPPYPLYYFGLFFKTSSGDYLGGVLIYTREYSQNTKNWDKYGLTENLILLARGVCIWWTPKNTGSYLISLANKWLLKNTHYRVVTATVDPMAGEIGTIYQACNWRYVGLMEGNMSKSGKELRRFGVYINGKLYGSRSIRKKIGTIKKETILEHYPDAKFVDQYRKRRYFVFLGDKKEKERNEEKIKHLFKTYPKRSDLSDLIVSHYGVIYKITNTINNKVYIGQTLRPLKYRIEQYRRGKANSYLDSAFKKYGFDNFTFDVIYESENILDLNDKEIYFIKEYDSTNKDKGYNLHIGGGNSIPTLETRLKMSLSAKGRKQDDEWVKNRIHESGSKDAKKYGRPKTEEDKMYLSEKMKGENGYWYGKSRSDETKKKIRDKKTGVKMSEKTYKETLERQAKKVERTSPTGEVKTYDSITFAANDIGLSVNTVTSYCKGKFKNKEGYIFRFI